MKNKKDFWLYSRPIAHRGLWNTNIKENSLSAYKNAIDNNYPIEIDLYATIDGTIVSFHDKNLLRMTGVNENIFDLSFDEIKKLKLQDSKETIPTLDEILTLCENKTPLLIELKNQPSKNFVSIVLNKLKDYKGEFAIQSFNPLYIKQVKDFDSNIVRGILSTDNAEDESFINKFIVNKMPLNFMAKPNFISREYTSLDKVKGKNKNLPLLAWTVTSQKNYDKIKNKVSNIIFENFIPK